MIKYGYLQTPQSRFSSKNWFNTFSITSLELTLQHTHHYKLESVEVRVKVEKIIMI